MRTSLACVMVCVIAIGAVVSSADEQFYLKPIYEGSYDSNWNYLGMLNQSAWQPGYIEKITMTVRAVGLAEDENLGGVGMDITLSPGLTPVYYPGTTTYWNALTPNNFPDVNADGDGNLNDLKAVLLLSSPATANAMQYGQANRPNDSLGYPTRIGSIYVQWDQSAMATVTLSPCPLNGAWWYTVKNNSTGNGTLYTQPTADGRQYAGQYVMQAQPRNFGIFIGSNATNADGVTVNGQADAASVRDKLASVAHFNSGDLHTITVNYSDSSTDVAQQVSTLLNSLGVQPGDNLFFYYSGHGTTSNGQYFLNATGSSAISDATLASWFDNTKFNNVNKYVMLDSCHSGGFWNGSINDLGALPKVGFLAAASASGLALADTAHGYQGYFSEALAAALTMQNGFAAADTGHDGLTFDDIQAYMANNYLFSGDGEITGYVKDDPTGVVTQAWDADTIRADDLQSEVPEPATLSLLALGAMAMLGRRGRRG